MDIDNPKLDAGQVAKLAHLDVTEVHTWTTRGLCNPYQAPDEIRRGRGRMRSYSIGMPFRFRLMGLLHKQYRVPLPEGRRICEHAFGESVNIQKVRYLLVRSSRCEH